MCSGAIVLYKIPRAVVGENQTFLGAEDYMRSQGIQVDVVQDPDCIQLMQDFIRANPQLWNEDIGV
jgi:cytosine deaminase